MKKTIILITIIALIIVLGVLVGKKISQNEQFEPVNSNKIEQNTNKMMENILSKDSEIKEIINEIKELEKQATYLENIGDDSYKLIDEEIKKKSDLLNSKQVYIEYLNKMEEFNDELAISSKMINDYVEEKV